MSGSDSGIGGLTGLRVVKNCPANWSRMNGDEQVRFCTHCSKKVYNLSGMDRESAEELLNSSAGKICARFYVRPDGMVMTSDCPKPMIRRTKQLAALAGIASVFGIAFFPGQLQGVVISPEAEVRQDLRKINEIGVELKDAKDPDERAELLSSKEEVKKSLWSVVERIRQRDK